MLLIVKGVVDEEDDEMEGDASLQYDDGSYVSGNTRCSVVDWVVGRYVRVRVSRVGREQLVKVPLVSRSHRVDGVLVTVE